MFKSGDKFEVNPACGSIVEIIGLYPKGQCGYTEDHVEIMINGHRIKIPVSFVSDGGLLKPVEAPAPVVEAPAPVVVKEAAPVKKATKGK